MGRELRRVPLDFNWPLHKPWGGFINPFHCQSTPCPHCEGGWSKDYKRLQSLWYSRDNSGFKPEDRGSKPYMPNDPMVQAIIRRKVNNPHNSAYFGTTDSAVMREAIRMCDIWNGSWQHHLNELDVAALLAADRLWDFTRRPRLGFGEGEPQHTNGWLKKSNGYVPTPKEVNDWSLCGFGHDSCNRSIVIRAELKRLGLPEVCDKCNGDSTVWPTPAIKRRYDRFKEIPPPKGDGYQIWETVSEGSPVSPVFATPEELADWMCAVGNDSSVTRNTTREQWMKFILGPGWAPSLIGSAAGVVSGVQAVTSTGEPHPRCSAKAAR